METSLDSLDPTFKPYAILLLARLVEARLTVLIVNTRRTQAEQDAAIARHVSWVPHSKHQDGLAIDLAPYAVWALHGDDKVQWDAHDPVWLKMGQIGEAIGLRWGGRWIKTPDYGHFEYIGATVIGVPV
jgi:D-alanyl-D-alanine carboxypeptidase